MASNRHTPISAPSLETEEILHFSLDGLLPEEHTLAIDLTTEVMALLTLRSDRCFLLSTQQLTPGERYVLIPLLESYPYFCTYELLFASYNSTHPTEAAIERCRKQLHAAEETGTWDQLVRPMRGNLSRVRFKLRLIGLDVVSLLSTGYILREARPGQKS